MGAEAFRFDGQHAVVLGGATGMGAAAARTLVDLGATVTVLDIAEVAQEGVTTIKVNLADKASVDAAATATAGPVDALLCCAGVADGTPGIERINYIAHQHYIDRLLEQGKLPRGSAIAMVSSVAGLGWRANLEQVQDFLAQPGWDAQQAWIDAHPGTAGYSFAKQAMNAYVSQNAFSLLQSGIRVNAILPGPTDTPLARANAEIWLGFGTDYRSKTGMAHLQPEEMGNSLIFLCSRAASGITGVTLLVDQGQVSSAITGSFPDMAINFLESNGQM